MLVTNISKRHPFDCIIAVFLTRWPRHRHLIGYSIAVFLTRWPHRHHPFGCSIAVFLTRWPHRRHPGSVILIEALLVLLAVCVGITCKYHPPSEFINTMKGDPAMVSIL